ncbi:unnamed protein product [Discula destructiva]
MTCEHCANLRPAELQNPGASLKARVPKWVTIGVLKASTCAECQLVWKALQLYDSNFKDEDMVEILISRAQPLRVKYKGTKVSIDIFTRKVDAVGDLRDGPLIGTTGEVSEHSSSEACFAAAASWLQQCRDNHPTCQIPGKIPLPTRVLDVGQHGVREPFLVETHGDSGKPYVALSYCWGWWEQHPPMKTVKQDVSGFGLKANYEEFRQAIKFSEMPKTIQDAVTITRRLGLQYLWVDALCIVQHDLAEWLAESGKMCEVYSNASLTISATQAPGSSVGIFGKQSFGSQTQCLGNLADGRKVFCRPSLGKLHNDCDWGLLSRVPATLDWSTAEQLTPEPLAARAWCMQESVLSNRILHYTSDEMMWECNETQQCECGFGSGTADPNENPNILLRRPDVVLTDDHDMNFFWRNMWSNYLHIFSRRSITDGKDKLPALSGLAKKFSGVLARRLGHEPTYLAGLWGQELLLRCLGWYVSHGTASWPSDDPKLNGAYMPRRPKEYRAPSWSFMSLDAPITPLDAFAFESSVDIKEAVTELPEGPADPFGQVTSGKIVLFGRLITDLDCVYTGTDFHLDDGSTSSNKKITFFLEDKVGNSLPFVCDVPAEVSQGHSPGYGLLLLGYKIIGFSMKEPCFLVLRRSSQAGCYERIGLASERSLPDHVYDEGKWDSKWAEDLQRGKVVELTLI